MKGNNEVFELKTVVFDEMLDWAVMKANKDLDLRPVKFKRTYPSLGEPIDMVSWPSDYGLVYTKGIVSGQQFLSYYVQTFCWLGSSGICFHRRRKVYRSASRHQGWILFSVGDAQLLNNMCLVRPLASITDKELYEALRDYDGGEARRVTY